MEQFLECVTAAALTGLRELRRLHEIEKKVLPVGISVRSRLPDVFEAMLRVPIVTAGSLAKTLNVTPQGALRLLRQLMAGGIVGEATGRASWRAYTLKA